MRVLVALLVLLNIGFAAWQLARSPVPTKQLSPADPAVEPLRLLSEIAAPPGIPVQNAAAPPPAPVAESPAVTCYSVGPFPDPQLADKSAQRLKAAGIGVRQRLSESREVVGYRVVLPPLSSKESALQVARQITADGVSDYQVIVDDSQRNVISLGVFKDQQAASRRQAQIAALGYAPRIETRDAQVQSYWLDTRENKQLAAASGAWGGLLAEVPQARRHEQPCP